MEKITLKPSIKELIYKNGEDNVHFDVLSYQGASSQEKMLGSLFVLGHIKYAEENLAYAISLISSLAKREYYSERSFQEQNAKGAFERTLKKLNEVLNDFFQNKNFKLNIGLAAISGENIYISRLGKFKIALARNGKYIDILNNVELFSKDTEGEKQFSNIISGKVQPNDKIFAYFPSRSITSREKQLNDIFVKKNQEEFSQKIANLVTNATNFSCCGIHIDMREIKEIPISPAVYLKPDSKEQASSERAPNNKDKKNKLTIPSKIQSIEQSDQMSKTAMSLPTTDISLDAEMPESQVENLVSNPKGLGTSLDKEQSHIMPAEFLVSKRASILTPVIGNFQKMIFAGKPGEHVRRHRFIMISAIVLLPVLILVFLRIGRGSTENRNIVRQAGENLKLAQSRINQSDLKDARTLLQASLASLTGISDKKAEDIKQQLNQTLDGLDRISDKQPEFFADLPAQADVSAQNQDFKANFISVYNDFVSTTNTAGFIFSANQNEVSQLGQFKTTPQFLFATPLFIFAFNGSSGFSAYDLKSKKIEQYSLKEPTPAIDAVLYENNLYTLSNNTIFKYADAATGGIKRTVWTSDSANDNLMSIAADGNIYTLAADGKLATYFKGKKTGELDLRLIPSSSSHIFTFKDSAFIFLADKTNKKVYIFDKTTGELKIAYKLDSVGTSQDISVSPDGTVWILSADNKIWRLQ